MLAVLHHLLVTERCRSTTSSDLAADLTRDSAVIEFVAPDDPMFRRLTRGRDHLHTGLTASLLRSRLRVTLRDRRAERAQGGTRVLYLLKRRG